MPPQTRCVGQRMNAKMKTINYRGGLVSFEIPSHWKEEYEVEGGGTFYEDNPNSGTLRLNVLSFNSNKSNQSSDVIRDVFGHEGHEILSCGYAMRHFLKKAEEQGTPLHLYRWEVLVPVSQTQYRIVCFTHTLLATQEGTDLANSELHLVDSLVRAAYFSTEQGKTQKEPWWKIW